MVRVVPSQRRDRDRLMKVAGTPMHLTTAAFDDIENATDPHRGPPGHRVDGPDSDDLEALSRRVPILARDLRTHDYTPGCRRCDLLPAGQTIRARSHNHTEECRKRIYERMRLAMDPRILRADADGVRVREQSVDEPNLANSAAGSPSGLDAPPQPEAEDDPLSGVKQYIDDDLEDFYKEVDLDPSSEPATLEPVHDGDDAADLFMDSDAEGGMAVDPNDGDMVAMVGVMQILGVDPVCALRFAVDTVRRKPQGQSLMNMYGRGNIVEAANAHARSLNIAGLDALDLRTLRPDGDPWEFTIRAHRRLAVRLVRERKPTWLIGSPPCSPFSTWMAINGPKMDPERRRRELEEGRAHLRCMVALYRLQLKEGRHFLHEHPQGAASWKEQCMLDLLKHHRVGTSVSHQCEYGLYAMSPSGERLRAMKPTRWASSSPQMLERLNKRCQRDHRHQHLDGGRTRAAAFYPPELVLEILCGIRDTADAELGVQEEEKEQPLNPVYAIADVPAFVCLTILLKQNLLIKTSHAMLLRHNQH